MASPSRIGRILDHLTWLRSQIGAHGQNMDERQTLDHAVLVYSAATLFEWHVTVSSPDAADFPYSKRDQREAKKRASRFVSLVAKIVDEMRETRQASSPKKAKPAATHAEDLERGLDTFLKSLPPGFSDGLQPVHHPDLELPIDPAALLREMVGSLEAEGGGREPAPKRGEEVEDPFSPLVQVLGAVFALDELNKTGELLPEAHATLQDVAAGYLADALGEAAESTPRSIARRLKHLERQVAHSIAPVERDSNRSVP